MYRSLTSEERIRRAEEIYNRRRVQNGIRVSSNHVNSGKKNDYKMFKKMILQIIICLLIYFIFYLIKNSNYIFSEDVINKTREFLSYDINFQNIYNQFGDYYNNNLKKYFEINEQNNENDKKEEINNNDGEKVEETEEQGETAVDGITTQQSSEDTENSKNEEGGVGGGEEGEKLLSNEITQVSADEEPAKPLTQMEIDANEIKANYNLILPLKGTITSRFGPRTPTEIVSANHAGIDIAVNQGTVFIAAMEGIVSEVSSEGGYGNHVLIKNGDVITLYAHCKTIYVKQGDKISQGQQIGEVGQTGNATGPHLHFEIRKDNRVVNPEYILQF